MEVQIPEDAIRSRRGQVLVRHADLHAGTIWSKIVSYSVATALFISGCYAVGAWRSSLHKLQYHTEGVVASNLQSRDPNADDVEDDPEDDDGRSSGSAAPVQAEYNPRAQQQTGSKTDYSTADRVAAQDYSLGGITSTLLDNYYVAEMADNQIFKDGSSEATNWNFEQITAQFRAQCKNDPEWARVKNFNKYQDIIKSSIKTDFWFKPPLNYSGTKVITLDLWSRFARCDNIVSPEDLVQKYLSGKANASNVIMNFQDASKISASFASGVGSEIMMANIWYYGGKGSDENTWSTIPVNHEKSLDTSSALAWGLIAVLRQSERAAEFLNEQILPQASRDQIKFAIELVIQHARRQVSAVEQHQQQQSVRRNSLVNSIPRIVPIDFQNSGKDDVIRAIDKNIASIDNFFRSGGGSDYQNNMNNELAVCNYSIRDVPGPASLSLPIIKRNYDACLAVLKPAVAAREEKIRRFDRGE